MGKTDWSDAHYKSRVDTRAATGTPTFAYDASMRAKAVHDRKIHASLDPKGVKFRESRDSDAHPTTLAISVMFDQTGSMGGVPVLFQKALPSLMGLLMRKGYVEHPAIMFGCFGDATCDPVAPLQVGQFECGIEMEDHLTNFYLEQGGGGQNTESYELAMYFMSRHTVQDNLEKRSKRGYLFLTGDELYYPKVKKLEVEALIGDVLQDSIPTPEIMAELQEKYDVYFLIPGGASNTHATWLIKGWQELLGQQVLHLEDPNAICELVASTIGLAEGYDLDTIGKDLDDAGVDSSRRKAVTKALVPMADAGGTGKAVALPKTKGGSGLTRLD